MQQEKEVAGFVCKKIALLDKDTPWARGMCAKLRRGIGKAPGELPELWEATLADAPDAWKGNFGAFKLNAVHMALTLYALHRQGSNKSMSFDDEEPTEIGDSLGAATARLCSQDDGNFEAVKRRFDAVVTSASFTELAHHARGIIQMLKAEDIIMDYPLFAADLYKIQFAHLAKDVRLRWGQDFYRVINKAKNAANDGKDQNVE